MPDLQHAPLPPARAAIDSERAMRRAVPMPSTWPPNSELRFVGRHHALRQLNGFLGAADRPSASLLALAAEVDAELPLRETEAPETLPPPCSGCARCADRRRPTTPARGLRGKGRAHG